MRLGIPACIAFGLAACDQGTLGGSARADAESRPDAGSKQPASRPSPSPGTVTVRLELPSTRAFCDPTQYANCPDLHFSVRTAAGQPLAVTLGTTCLMFCSSACQEIPCTAGACLVPGGTITQIERTWDGSYYEQSICGLGVGCISQKFAPPGHYVAQMCATPGMIVEGDAGQSGCTATGPQECVDVPFDFPSQSPIEATLP